MNQQYFDTKFIQTRDFKKDMAIGGMSAAGKNMVHQSQVVFGIGCLTFYLIATVLFFGCNVLLDELCPSDLIALSVVYNALDVFIRLKRVMGLYQT